MRKLINYCATNPWAGILIGIVVLFIYLLFTDSFLNALIGAVFFGILGTPITGFILTLIDDLLLE